MQAPGHPIARVTRTFNASAERVFDAWMDPAMIGTWMFGPAVRDEQVVHIDIDPTMGGSFSFLVLRHGKAIDHIGEYQVIDRPQRLAFTWAVRQDPPDGSRVSIDIAPLGAQACQLTLTHELHPNWAEYVPQTEGAWNKMLDALTVALGK